MKRIVLILFMLIIGLSACNANLPSDNELIIPGTISDATTISNSDDSPLPTFDEFRKSVQNGQADILRGVYVTNVLALPIVQQPSNNPTFVSNTDGEVTQFRLAANYGNIGLLAHNNLAGKQFFDLAIGQRVLLIYGDGHLEFYKIIQISTYQALQPHSVYSSYRNLSKDENLTMEQMFKRVYFGNKHITFQTCVEAEGNTSWGRLFVIATPAEEGTLDNYNRLYGD